MEEIKNEQTLPSTQTVATEKEEGVYDGTVSLGKFKDVGALLNAYNSLQSEFTKRCQKIKELEGKLNSGDKTTVPTEEEQKVTTSHADTTFVDKEKILKDYLLDVLGKKPSAIIMDGAGVGVKTPIKRPTTIEEAGNLAKNLLNKNQ